MNESNFTTVTFAKMLPHSEDAEKGLLCSCFREPDEVLAEISGKIKSEHFYSPARGMIYQSILDTWLAGQPVTPFLINEDLTKRGELEKCGGVGATLDLHAFIATSGLWVYYTAIVREKHALRGIIEKCSEYLERAASEQEDPDALLNGILGDMGQLSVADNAAAPQSMRELLREKIDRMQAHEEDPDIIPTGIDGFDRQSPLKLGAMPVIAAERKAGKSILALNILKAASAAGDVIYFSLEDKKAKIVDRLTANESRVPAMKHFIGQEGQTGGMTEGDFQSFSRALDKLSPLGFWIIDDLFDIASIVAFSKKWKAQHPGLVAIVVDYVQLVRGNQKKGSNREQEIAGISRALRLLAMELHVAVIALSQLNKDGGTRESQAIEQDCTALWKINRVFKDPVDGEEAEEDNGRRSITIPFQRDGESNVYFPIAFMGHIARIEELAYENEN